MVLLDTKEMKALYEKFKSYLNERLQLPADAPEEVKQAFAEYIRLGKEQEEFALSL